MNTLLLEPIDTLFFRDGRPMSGSLSGHGAAWPLPTVTSAALHAALHRAQIEGIHKHVRGRSSDPRDYTDANRESNGRFFGSLTTAGPFPVSPSGTWFFPRPGDAQKKGSALITLQPTQRSGACSVPHHWLHPVGNTQPPTKDKPEPWLSQAAFRHYLDQTNPPELLEQAFLNDSAFTDTEHSIGIGISPEAGTQDGERIYSAHSLRLRDGWRLGLQAAAWDKDLQSDLIATLFPNSGTRTPVIVGGQQRLCTVVREHRAPLPLPLGATITGTRVKWVLLTPAVFPQIEANDAKGIQAHRGGWLPSWILPDDGQVMLKSGDTDRQPGERRDRWRERVKQMPNIDGQLVASLVGKPIPVTGYALPHKEADRTEGGAKSTHLAVPAGSVYYFECADETAAQAFATAINWHGATSGTTIRNRRSTLMGEKGFGLGVCGTWDFHPNPKP